MKKEQVVITESGPILIDSQTVWCVAVPGDMWNKTIEKLIELGITPSPGTLACASDREFNRYVGVFLSDNGTTGSPLSPGYQFGTVHEHDKNSHLHRNCLGLTFEQFLRLHNLDYSAEGIIASMMDENLSEIVLSAVSEKVP